MIFSIAGAKVVLSISADVVLGIVIIVLSALFLYVLFNPQFGKEEEVRENKVIPVTVGMGAGLGFYEGFLGPGTGSMLMAGYIKGAGFGMDRAAATGRILNFGGNIGSFAVLHSPPRSTTRWQYPSPWQIWWGDFWPLDTFSSMDTRY